MKSAGGGKSTCPRMPSPRTCPSAPPAGTAGKHAAAAPARCHGSLQGVGSSTSLVKFQTGSACPPAAASAAQPLPPHPSAAVASTCAAPRWRPTRCTNRRSTLAQQSCTTWLRRAGKALQAGVGENDCCVVAAACGSGSCRPSGGGGRAAGHTAQPRKVPQGQTPRAGKDALLTV